MPDTDAEIWDLNRGPRLFVFPTDLETALGSLASTMLLFEPTLTQGILRQCKTYECTRSFQNRAITVKC